MRQKKRSSTRLQFFNDTTDSLSAMRSANGWVMFIILSALVFTIVFNMFFIMEKVSEVSIRNSPVSVVAVNGDRFLNRGDVALVLRDEKYYCVRVKKKTDDGIVALRGGKEISYSDDEIIGRTLFIVQPLVAFGDKPQKACAEF